MWNKLFGRVFFKFVLVGIINTLFGTIIMFVFYNVFHFNYWISSAANYVFGSILSYFLNKNFTFEDKSKDTRTIIRFVINISVCYFIAYGVAKPMMRFVLSGTTSKNQENVAMLVGMCLFVILNYCGQRFFTFKGYEK